MAEGLLVRVGPSASKISANQRESLSAQNLLGAGLQEEGVAKQQSAYCRDLLLRGGVELSFEELRAERYNQQKQQQLDEKLRQLTEVKEQLNQELQEKTGLLQQLRTLQRQGCHEGSAPQVSDSVRLPPASSFQIYDESQSAVAMPSGNSEASTSQPVEDVFLPPVETRLCQRVQCPGPGTAVPSEESQRQNLSARMTSDTLVALETRPPPSDSQTPASRTSEKLSPIKETSVEAGSLTSLGGKDQGDHSPSSVGAALDPCDPELRQRLLDLCDVTSSPDFYSEPRPLPDIEEVGCFQLGGEVYHVYSKLLDGGSFCVYQGANEDGPVIVKVDSSSVPWDFHLFQRLKQHLATDVSDVPRISCFQFLDGCITVYTPPPHHLLTELTERVPSEASVGYKAVALLQLVLQLHSCRLLHAALQPCILTCCHRGFCSPDWLFPLDWSSAVDLELQQDVVAVRQLPSAQTYISRGVLDPSAPPQQLDLLGVAETVHLLLTNSSMVLVRDAEGWTPEQFSGDQPCDMFSGMWRRFFRALLNGAGGSSLSVLSELVELLSSLYN
ncbi:mitotic checkpoint serine/threonine-protein kinase BUB1 beta [Aulostomus maculatus]